MNKELWNKILQFDFDYPPGEYGFSARLANENYWTKNFTRQALLEYKKFMYLAATSEFMVSPSEIVDIVWHQHLIFTQSYQEFCTLIGKQVQHIPSTHNKEDFQKFKQAKERTIAFYESVFGTQPRAIWAYTSMYESLNLKKAKFKVRSFLVFGILSFGMLVAPFYYVLRPLYVGIDNPYFMMGYVALIVLTFLFLEFYNQRKLIHITRNFDKNSFVYDLQPYELIYLKKRSLSDIINGVINELVDYKRVKVHEDYSIELCNINGARSSEEQQTINALSGSGKTSYATLLNRLVTLPVFWNTANCMQAFKKYVNKSQEFGILFYTNFVVLATVLMLGLVRLSTGILRDKPVALIALLVGVVLLSSVFYLKRLTGQLVTDTIPHLYTNEILLVKKTEDSWQWRYFLLGNAALAVSFAPVVQKANASTSDGSTCGNSCGSSCGSSCSSCGGCGGD